MLKNLVAKAFSSLAQRAVESAEANFGEGKGMAKKRFAINFVLARVPISGAFRPLLENILVELIDIAIESACKKIKS